MEATNLAAAILQLAVFTGKLLSTAHEVYRSGDSKHQRQRDLEYAAGNFKEMIELIKAGRAAAFQGDDRERTHLDDVAEQACSVTEDLVKMLEKVSKKPDYSQDVWQSVRQALLFFWKESEIQELEQRVASYRDQINIALLVDLRYVANR